MLVPAVVLSPLSKFQYLFRPPLKLQRFFFLSFLSLFSVSIQTSSEVILWVDHSVHRQLFCFSHDNCLLSDFSSSTVSQIGRNWNCLYIRENSLSFYGEQTIYHRPITKTKLLKRRVGKCHWISAWGLLTQYFEILYVRCLYESFEKRYPLKFHTHQKMQNLSHHHPSTFAL